MVHSQIYLECRVEVTCLLITTKSLVSMHLTKFYPSKILSCMVALLKAAHYKVK